MAAQEEGTTVTSATGTSGVVRVYWRPGCPFCARLRLGLRGARVRAEWVNIWEDQAAAARVRAITGGDETVPTVVVGTKTMINPSARQVVRAVRAGQPGTVPADGTHPASWLARAACSLARRWPRRGHAAGTR
jgi:glutaredoxin-like protein